MKTGLIPAATNNYNCIFLVINNNCIFLAMHIRASEYLELEEDYAKTPNDD